MGLWARVLCAAGVPDLLAAMDISRLTVGPQEFPRFPIHLGMQCVNCVLVAIVARLSRM